MRYWLFSKNVTKSNCFKKVIESDFFQQQKKWQTWLAFHPAIRKIQKHEEKEGTVQYEQKLEHPLYSFVDTMTKIYYPTFSFIDNNNTTTAFVGLLGSKRMKNVKRKVFIYINENWFFRVRSFIFFNFFLNISSEELHESDDWWKIRVSKCGSHIFTDRRICKTINIFDLRVAEYAN